ncbi:MAG: formiminoglutamate deiminase [Verrucomicrobiales bacterium]|jgi:formiminoglutamate deiminase
MTTWWCEHAVVDGRLESGVSITCDGTAITSVAVDSIAGDDAVRLPGVTLPGFANAHSHAFHRALRSRVQAERGTFWTWRDLMYTAAERLDPDNYYRLAVGVFAEMALAGTSCVGEFHYVHHSPDGTPYDDANAMGKALLAAAQRVGIRITLLDTLYLHGGLTESGYAAPVGAQRRFTDGSADSWAARVDALSTTNTQRIGAAIHSVRAVDPKSMRAAVEWTADREAPLHAHVSEQVAENEQCVRHHGCSPVELLGSVDALTSRFTAVHATHLSESDIAHLGSCGATVCMCPTTERDLGDGIGPTVPLIGAGARLSLGSDSHAVIDQMVEARAVEMHERLASETRGVHSAFELLEMATSNGHRSLGWEDAGQIRAGQRGDLTTISFSSQRLAGTLPEFAVEAAIFASTTSDITSVVVDGEQIVCDGQHRSIDVASELRGAIEELLS